MVTDETWNQIIDLILHKCKNIKLARFQGMYGIDSYKAKFMKTFFGITPFHRHDWIVMYRCVISRNKIFIDYYAISIR